MKKFVEVLTGKRVNLLIGAGTSNKIIPTLSLYPNNLNFVDLLNREYVDSENIKKLIVFYYYHWVLAGDSDAVTNHPDFQEVSNEYFDIINAFINFQSRENSSSPRRLNIFTTNFDPVFEIVFDNFLPKDVDCFFCDGGRGFITRHFSIRNFYLNVSHSGYFDKYKREIPTINLFKLHGSISWKNSSGSIAFTSTDSSHVTNVINRMANLIGIQTLDSIKTSIFSPTTDMTNKKKGVREINHRLTKIHLNEEVLDSSLDELKELPIINPMDWKFEQTVFEQNYYQLIRALSYELEEEDSVLISLGSSFSDPHINEIIKRSLTNPKLLPIYVCFDESSREKIEEEFKNYQCYYMPSKDEFLDGEKGTLKYLTNKILTGDFNE